MMTMMMITALVMKISQHKLFCVRKNISGVKDCKHVWKRIDDADNTDIIPDVLLAVDDSLDDYNS